MIGERAEQFDQALKSMLDGRDTPTSEFSDLLDLCARLRDLPRSDFRL